VCACVCSVYSPGGVGRRVSVCVCGPSLSLLSGMWLRVTRRMSGRRAVVSAVRAVQKMLCYVIIWPDSSVIRPSKPPCQTAPGALQRGRAVRYSSILRWGAHSREKAACERWRVRTRGLYMIAVFHGWWTLCRGEPAVKRDAFTGAVCCAHSSHSLITDDGVGARQARASPGKALPISFAISSISASEVDSDPAMWARENATIREAARYGRGLQSCGRTTVGNDLERHRGRVVDRRVAKDAVGDAQRQRECVDAGDVSGRQAEKRQRAHHVHV
jgi:hypothetical protein